MSARMTRRLLVTLAWPFLTAHRADVIAEAEYVKVGAV